MEGYYHVIDITSELTRDAIIDIFNRGISADATWEPNFNVILRNKSNRMEKISYYDRGASKKSTVVRVFKKNGPPGGIVLYTDPRVFKPELILEVVTNYEYTCPATGDWVAHVCWSVTQTVSSKNSADMNLAYDRAMKIISADAPPQEGFKLYFFLTSSAEKPQPSAPQKELFKERIQAKKDMDFALRIFAGYVNAPPQPTLKMTINQPAHLSRAHYLYQLRRSLTGYYASVKIDGLHCIGVNIGRRLYYVFDNECRTVDSGIEETYIADMEFVDGKYHVLDVIAFNNEHVSFMPFGDRYTYFPAIADKFKKFDWVAEKEFIVFSDPDKVYSRLIEMRKKFPKNDGYVFYSPSGDYKSTVIYKVKPAEKNTIDFYLRAIPDDLRKKYGGGEEEGTSYFLFVGIRPQLLELIGIRKFEDYDRMIGRNETQGRRDLPIQFSPMTNPRAFIWHGAPPNLDRRVCELLHRDGTWYLDRLRPDKEGTFGNAFLTAETQWMDNTNPLTLEFICGKTTSKDDEEEGSYFNAPAVDDKNNLYSDINRSNREFKRALYKAARGSSCLDLAGGRGADFIAWIQAGFGSVFVVDADIDAISELARRRAEMAMSQSYRRHRDSRFPHIMALVADLNQPYANTIDLMEPYGVRRFDTVCCNFAIHYFISTLQNFVSLVAETIKPGGHFFYTCFDGERVLELLVAGDGLWEVYQDERIKYRIRAPPTVLKDKAAALKMGAQIDVLLPFSNGNLYPESLVDVTATNGAFEAAGFEVVKIVRKDDIDKLPEVDRVYAGLFVGVLLRKK